MENLGTFSGRLLRSHVFYGETENSQNKKHHKIVAFTCIHKTLWPEQKAMVDRLDLMVRNQWSFILVLHFFKC
jgi:hypothetical protein